MDKQTLRMSDLCLLNSFKRLFFVIILSDFVNIEMWKSYPFVFTVETIWVHSFGMGDKEKYWTQRKNLVLSTGHEED